jgi:nucleoid-associated protein YgaU
VDGSSRAPGRRTLTPAVLAAALFLACCAVTAITFVAARGGLDMPLAPTAPAVAVASPAPTQAPTPAATEPGPSPSPAPTAEPTLPPSASPTSAPPATTAPTAGAPTLNPSDPLLALPACPDLPGCFEYTIRHGDTLSGVAGRYLIPVSTVLALNPEITDRNIVVVGQILYLGRDPFLRLPPCPDTPDCSLYTVRSGDTLSTIAGRFSITVDAILAANPSISNPSSIVSGQVLHLPHPTA